MESRASKVVQQGSVGEVFDEDCLPSTRVQPAHLRNDLLVGFWYEDLQDMPGPTPKKKKWPDVSGFQGLCQLKPGLLNSCLLRSFLSLCFSAFLKSDASVPLNDSQCTQRYTTAH